MMPEIGAGALTFFRCAYGLLLLTFLAHTLPHARRFFLSERWRGYAASSGLVDATHNPVIMPLVMTVWTAAAAALALGRWTVPAALVNLLICRGYFISMRWRSVARGLGAPGFMTHWLAGAVLLLEYARGRADPHLLSVALLALQLDFACLYLSSGCYKLFAGYARGAGMDLGMVNPQWGRWWRRLRHLAPTHPLFRVSNQAAWSLELLAGALMLLPGTRAWGGILLVVSFAYVALFTGLGALPPMVMLVGVLYLGSGTGPEAALGRLAAWLPSSAPTTLAVPGWIDTALVAGLWAYVALLPVVYAGLSYNLYGGRRLPRPWQRLLDGYANLFGTVLWRVFSADLVDFFIRVYREPPGEAGGEAPDPDAEITRRKPGARSRRFGHVAESITLTCIFTTLKYHPGRPGLFRERIVRYARSLPLAAGERALFRYVVIEPRADRYAYRTVAEFRVDPAGAEVRETTLDPDRSIRSGLPVSPLHEGARPGSYAPADP